ncbi:hypothetical protein RRF57_009936 [Xylaria bambusicola]|uniref:Uncharacterized protein n=1 Tax=Xylaria bambusicola TaxID=326684 RepID=A0AAN7Z9A0_9PEZI
MGDTVARINNSTGQRAISYLGRCPGRSEGEDGLDGDVETSTIEGFEKDLSGILTVFRGVQRLVIISNIFLWSAS